MKKFITCMLAIVLFFMVCKFSFGILCYATSRNLYVAPNNEVYLQLDNRFCMPEFY